jgi:hypothetical protein
MLSIRPTKRRRRRTHHRRARARRIRRRISAVGGAVLGVLALALLWVGIRGAMAGEALQGAIPTAQAMQASVLAGDTTALDADVDALQARTTKAVGLTSDPIWRALELVPGLGPNLRSVRVTAAAADRVSYGALPSLVQLASAFQAGSLTPRAGAVDPQAFAAIAPAAHRARVAMDAAAGQTTGIDPAQDLPPVAAPVQRFAELISTLRTATVGLDTAAQVLPDMLGSDAPRRYLLLSMNPAELRPSGGIVGAVSVVTADRGRLTLDEQSSGAAFGRLASPALAPTPAESALFQGLAGTYMQDATFPPDFARAAQYADAIWTQAGGAPVDGVVALDPVAVSLVLAATGPVGMPDGSTLTSADAVPTLLSGTYAAHPDPAAQDAYFTAATRALFDAVTGGAANGPALAGALGSAVVQHRVLVWDAHPEIQSRLAGTAVVGALPATAPAASAFGIYLADGTGSKMDFYLRPSAQVASAMCAASGRPTFRTSVTLGSVAPADAATALPWVVTGGGAFGVPAGTTRTNVFVVAPPGFRAYGVEVDGREVGFTSTTLEGRPAVAVDVDVLPQRTGRVDILWSGASGAPLAATVATTPTATGFPVATSQALACTDTSGGAQ